MERSNTKLLTITDWSRKQNLSGQAEKHHWNCIGSEEGKCDELFAWDAPTDCLTHTSPHSNKVLETKQQFKTSS